MVEMLLDEYPMSKTMDFVFSPHFIVLEVGEHGFDQPRTMIDGLECYWCKVNFGNLKNRGTHNSVFLQKIRFCIS